MADTQNPPYGLPVEEYVGAEIPHIQLIMEHLSDICPPFIYPYTGPRDAPRPPHTTTLGRWTLASNTAPDGSKEAPLTSPVSVGHYFVGARWPTTANAPQCVLWVPPEEGTVRYSCMADRLGNDRGLTQADLDFIRNPQDLVILTAESPQLKSASYRRTGSIIEPWTVYVWGNSWADTWILAHWLASVAHDVERSNAERTGEPHEAAGGGWVTDKVRERGAVWKMKITLTLGIFRTEWDKTLNRYQQGTFAFAAEPTYEEP